MAEKRSQKRSQKRSTESCWLALGKETSVKSPHKESGLALLHDYEKEGVLPFSDEEIFQIPAPCWLNFFYRLSLLRKAVSPTARKRSTNWYKESGSLFLFDLNSIFEKILERRGGAEEENSNILSPSLVHLCALLTTIAEDYVVIRHVQLVDESLATLSHITPHPIWQEKKLLLNSPVSGWDFFLESLHLMGKVVILEVPLTWSLKAPALFQSPELISWRYKEDDPSDIKISTPKYQEEILRQIKRVFLNNDWDWEKKQSELNYRGIIPTHCEQAKGHTPFRFLNQFFSKDTPSQPSEEVSKQEKNSSEISFKYFQKLCHRWQKQYRPEGYFFDTTLFDAKYYEEETRGVLQPHLERLRESLPSNMALLTNLKVTQDREETSFYQKKVYSLEPAIDITASETIRRKSSAFLHFTSNKTRDQERGETLNKWQVFRHLFGFTSQERGYFISNHRDLKSHLRQFQKAKELRRELKKKKVEEGSGWLYERGLFVQYRRYNDGTQYIFLFNIESKTELYDLRRWHKVWQMQTLNYINFKSEIHETYLSYDSVIPIPSAGEGIIVVIY